jgi:LDH2 family malate/lactate/ureidoglycolate dehydrogenase
MRVSVAEATRAGVDALTAAGVPQPDAATQVAVLVEAELRGHPSHGLLRLRRIVDRIASGACDPRSTVETRWVGSALLEVDGNHGLGPVIALTALEAISRRAAETGLACASIRASGHLGMLSWYVERVAQAGQAAVAMTTSEALVHPWGGRQAMVGSNPIAIAVPADPAPLVFDMATALVSAGKIHDYANRNMPLPAGWALDETGDPTTDPERAKGGAIAPFGGAKGYGLGIALEAFVGWVTATAFGRDVTGTLDDVHPSTKGDLFIIIDPHRTGHGGALSAYLEAVRRTPRQHPAEPVLVPGDRAQARRRAALAHGIEIPDHVWATVNGLADRVPR